MDLPRKEQAEKTKTVKGIPHLPPSLVTPPKMLLARSVTRQLFSSEQPMDFVRFGSHTEAIYKYRTSGKKNYDGGNLALIALILE